MAHLRLQPGEDPQCLGVALEAAARRGELVERPLTVVPERRMPDVVGQPRGVHHVRFAAQLLGDLPADLRDLQGMGEPGARHPADLRPLPRPDDLGLARQATQRRGMQHPRPVTGERAAALGAAGALGRLQQHPRPVVLGVAVLLHSGLLRRYPRAGGWKPLLWLSTEASVSR
jgi:hypothetical protein